MSQIDRSKKDTPSPHRIPPKLLLQGLVARLGLVEHWLTFRSVTMLPIEIHAAPVWIRFLRLSRAQNLQPPYQYHTRAPKKRFLSVIQIPQPLQNAHCRSYARRQHHRSLKARHAWVRPNFTSHWPRPRCSVSLIVHQCCTTTRLTSEPMIRLFASGSISTHYDMSGLLCITTGITGPIF